MKIGTDYNLYTCRAEGYTIIEFKKRELFKGGKLDKDFMVRVTKSWPSGWTEGGKPRMDSLHDLYILDEYISWNDAYCVYIEHKEMIDSVCDIESNPINFGSPTEYDLLNLIDCVGCCCSLP